MYKDYWDGRKYNVSKDSKYANQTFVILPNKNLGRLNTLAEKLKSQDINIYTNKNPIEVEDVLMQSGNTKMLLLIDFLNQFAQPHQHTMIVLAYLYRIHH